VMSGKSSGQALDEISGHFGAIDRLRMIANRLSEMSNRMERVAKGIAVSSFDDDVTSEAMLKVAMKAAQSPSVSKHAETLALEAVSKAVEEIIGRPLALSAGTVRASSVVNVDVHRSISTPSRAEPSTSAEMKAAREEEIEESFFSQEEMQVMRSRMGTHHLHGVMLKPGELKSVEKVLCDARDHVLNGDTSMIDRYDNMFGAQAFRKHLFNNAVAAFRERTGIPEPMPLVEELQPPASSSPQVVVKPASSVEPSPALVEETASEDYVFEIPPPEPPKSQQLQLGIMPDDAPEFLKTETPAKPDRLDSWEKPFEHGAYSERSMVRDDRKAASEPTPAPKSGNVRSGFGLMGINTRRDKGFDPTKPN